ncbi:ABC transporter permease [Membranihabitans maritimus]|uniref:ABC transporter permease n=1 Tax=Membranihabitans maritimus TaxID=2904244 RepID=UPI001F33D40B|nr:ABC transporter permease [Membranihabitans maritimus]
MSVIKIAIKNLLHQPLAPILSILLIGLSVAMIVFSVRLNQQVEKRFNDNLADIDLILSAKGSPLQSVLCNLFHIDAPTGNIAIEDAIPHLREDHPFIETAIPLSLGDNYQGNRIVGTTLAFYDHYELELAQGRMIETNNEVIIGSTVAKERNLQLGDHFVSGHGIRDEGFEHDHGGELEVVGIFSPAGMITDHLIFTNPSTVWAQHEHDEESFLSTPVVLSTRDLSKYPDHEITSVLITFTGKSMQILNFGRNINEHTKIMAADPAIEINRLYQLMGAGFDITRLLAYAILIISLISIFLSQLMNLKNRIRDMAVIRMLGGKRSDVLKIIVFESLLIGITGILLGYLFTFLGITKTNQWMQESYQVSIPFLTVSSAEWGMVVLILIVCLVAALLPAFRLYKVNLYESLNQDL